MQILSYLLAGLLLAMLNLFIFTGNNKLSHKIANVIGFSFLINLVSVFFLKFIGGKEQILVPSSYTIGYSVKYVLITLFIGFVYLLIKAFACSKIRIEKYQSTLTKKDILLRILYVILFAIGATFFFFSNWFVDFFGKLTPEQFLFNLKSPIKGTSNEMMDSLLYTPLFGTIATTLLYIVLLGFKGEIYVGLREANKKILSKENMRKVSCILSIVLCISGFTYGANRLHFLQIAKAYFVNSSFIEENYHDPREVKLTFPEKKRNIIHIYLESVENSYLSKELGGNEKENLMPDLTKLSKEGIHFTKDKEFGGPYQTYGSSWSVASMMNMDIGIPLKIPMDGNSYGKSGTFLPGAVALGDILAEEGYNQTIMFGADADFGGLTTYFESHGNYNIFDYKAAKAKKLIPDDYHVWWGFEDDKLYEFAKDELLRLDKEGKPFNFTMETADTHFPDGYLSPKAKKKHEKKYANAIAYSQKEAVKFVRWIQKQSFYENTTIVITGDHLSMDQNFFTDYDSSYDRNVFNLILNAPVTTTNTKNREFAPFDFYPTMLASMGVTIEGDRLGLGTNLFSNEKTLVEQIGFTKLEENLTPKSNFFNDQFIDPKQNSKYTPKQ